MIRPALLVLAALGGCAGAAARPSGALERIVVPPGGRGFILADSKRPFLPWGFNYDHDEQGRLLEDYWDAEWPKVEEDFREMKDLGARVIRIHLQFGRFMRSPSEPHADALDRLGRLLELAERTGLYLDLTGLGCYHKKDVPAWYDALSETARWDAQARFWDAVAERGARSSAVFCYDLMNEPVVPGGKDVRKDWLGGAFGDKHFVQFITLDGAGRARPDVARAWIERVSAPVRRRDPGRLITVGLVHWSLDRPGLSSGFVPERIAPLLDFLAVHVYPERGKFDHDFETLRGFAVGKPVVVEETYALRCSAPELEAFMDRSGDLVAGWIGFYWGRTIPELRASNTMGDAFMLQWLELFRKKAP